jgi:hypothetical protein
MKLGGEIKTGRLSVRDEYKFVMARAPSPGRRGDRSPEWAQK